MQAQIVDALRSMNNVTKSQNQTTKNEKCGSKIKKKKTIEKKENGQIIKYE